MSAFGGKADMTFCGVNVRFYPKKADITPTLDAYKWRPESK
jgi:hypothetical protein